MNVNNFFRFIGEKFPEYKLSADNENLRKNFFSTYEKDVIEQNIDEDNVVSLYFGVENESTMNENGKNGKFIQYSAEAETYRDDDGERDIDFKRYKNIIDFKNDVKEGNDILYNITNSKNPKKLTNTEYKEGKKIKKIRYKYFNLNKTYGPFVENVTYYNDNGEEFAADFYRFITEKQGTEVIKSEPDFRRFFKKQVIINSRTGRPVNAITHFGSVSIENGKDDLSKSTIYFDSNGNEITKSEWEDLRNSNKEGYR